MLLDVSTCFFSVERCLNAMILSQKVFIEPKDGVKEAENCLKIPENCKYCYLQCHNSNAIKSFNIFLFF